MKNIIIIVIIIMMGSCGADSSVSSRSESSNLPPDPTGTSIPKEFHISWPPRMFGEVDGVTFEIDEAGRILKALQDENIDYKFLTYHGTKFLIWTKSQNDCVQEIIKDQIITNCVDIESKNNKQK